MKSPSNGYVLSPLNYIGGKGRLLPQLLRLFPGHIDCFLDLFCGGANVGINVAAERHFYNDISPAVTTLLGLFQTTSYERIISGIGEITAHYGLSDTSAKGYETYGANSSEGVADFNREKFLQLRADFNRLSSQDSRYPLYLYALVIFGFNNQIRFNSEGEYNLPVGKRDFNKSLQNKLHRFICALQLQKAKITTSDFRHLEVGFLTPNSLVYVDPPYLIATATYNENGGWGPNDENDLLNFLDLLNERGIKFALSNVLQHKGRVNHLLSSWIGERDFLVNHLQYGYANSNYQVKEKDTLSQEVLITNFTPPTPPLSKSFLTSKPPHIHGFQPTLPL